MSQIYVAIIDYGLGNLHSVLGAVEYLGYSAILTNDYKKIRQADKLILPGVGAFGDAISRIQKQQLDQILGEEVLVNKKPIMGICLGFQLLCNDSCEFGVHKGLGWLNASVKKLPAEQIRIPHVGWNDLFPQKASVLFDAVPEQALFYYVHSFFVDTKETDTVIGECPYGISFTAAIQKENIFGVQFHPEKSQRWGLQVLSNFIEKT